MSEIGSRLSPSCDFAVIWYYDHNRRSIKVSLRSFYENIDVSEIASNFGGGGHKKASGFTLTGESNIEDIFKDEEQSNSSDTAVISQNKREYSSGNPS